MLIRNNKLKRILFVFVILFLVACSVKNHHKTLSIFFDGAPEPEIQAPKPDSASVNDEKSFEPTQATVHYSAHPDFEDKACSSCHDIEQGNALTQAQPILCYDCHDDFSEQYAVLHGPVAGGYCTACHAPHKSVNPVLMRMPENEYCSYCHLAEDIYKNDIHEGLSFDECMDCHNPHGADDRFLLE